MKPLLDEIADAIKQARFDSINTERDPFDFMAQSAIDVVERRIYEASETWTDSQVEKLVSRVWGKAKKGSQ